MEFLNKFSGMAHVLPRLSLAATFLYHGLPKFTGAEAMAQMMGMPVFAVYLLALMEVSGALLILWGGVGPDWATRVSGLLFSVVMFGAIVMVHGKNGWSFQNGGAEFQTLVLVTSLYFAFKGNSANTANTANTAT